MDGSNPSRVCTVDGATIPNNVITAPVNGILHCQVFNLPDGNHTLEVTVPTANPNGYWFDSLLYIPSANVSRTNAMLMVRFDDPSFSFGPGWSQIGAGMLTTINGASMTFRFTGTQSIHCSNSFFLFQPLFTRSCCNMVRLFSRWGNVFCHDSDLHHRWRQSLVVRPEGNTDAARRWRLQ